MTKVEFVQLGLTTRCNSQCYFCFREELKRAGRTEGIVDFPVEGVKKILDQEIKDIQLCCNRGEAIFHPEIDTIIDMIKSSGSRFEMNTNGDRFDPNWWYDLGQKMTEEDQIIFAIDGLKNTHEKYRNTNWVRIIRNLKAFIQGGGNAVWQMILFKHNEHQVDFKQHKVSDGRIPNVRGMSSRDALLMLEKAGVNVRLVGHGRVKRQSLLPGYRVGKNTNITLYLG